MVALLLAGAASSAVVFAAIRSQRPARAVHLVVFPIPGSQVAEPGAQIVFRGVPVDRIRKITVRGSKSGLHTGKIKADSDGQGGSFIPAKPFVSGETVRVHLRILAAPHRTWQFKIADDAGLIPIGQRYVGARVPNDVWQFRSRPDLQPAAVQMLKTGGGSDDIFLGAQTGPVQNGPELLSPTGQLIWFKPASGQDTVTNFRVQRYQGKPVLTWWQGNEQAGHGRGVDYIYNTAYKQIAVVHAANGLDAGLHTFEITRQGTALITATNPVWMTIDGTRRIVENAIVQEIDIKTGLLLFEWDSLDHVSPRDSYMKPPTLTRATSRAPYDYFHPNSIVRDDDGNLVISARNTWAIYKVNYRSGNVMWTLGGKHSSFKLGKGAQPAFQHDARVQAPNDGLITLFDDGAGEPVVHKQSRAIEVRLDFRHHTATLTRQYEHNPPKLAYFEGNYQRLPDSGDAVVGWGSAPYFTQYRPDGKIVLDGRFVGNTRSYSAYRMPWHGEPRTAPAVAASADGSNTTVYASWNGASDVTAWAILAGPTPSSLTTVTQVPSTGFESHTTIGVAKYVQVEALGPGDRPLAHSRTIRVS